jgi:signal transduction histidine kinase
MTARRSTDWIYQGVFYLAAGLIYFAILLRSYLLYKDTPYLGQVLGLLLLFLILFLAEMAISPRVGGWFHLYLGLQTFLASLLIYGPDFKEYDYFSLLFSILGMQAMRRLSYQTGVSWILAYLVLIGYPFLRNEGTLEGTTRLLLFGSVIVFLASYALAIRRAQEARTHNQSLMQQLQETNLQLQTYSDTLEQLGVARERQRLARELHDSVTQTIFSMTLTTQSALLLLERDPNRVGAQLERLNQLAQSALAEMHTLISELRPEQMVGGGLVAALREHIKSRQFPEGLSVALEVEGEQVLSLSEEQGLFRIVQEALNNVVKHARASRASLLVHMVEPYWIEIRDDGQGFNLQQTQGAGRVGLASMRERAVEIGWSLYIQSTPGEGTHIRVEKKYPEEERA